MARDVVFSFGRHRGKSVAEVAVLEPSYLEWCLAQPGIQKDHPALFQVMIQFSAGQPNETPEHNAMQVRFLDDAYCVRFVQSLLKPDYEESLRKRALAVRKKRIMEAVEGKPDYYNPERKARSHLAWIKRHREDVAREKEKGETRSYALPAYDLARNRLADYRRALVAARKQRDAKTADDATYALTREHRETERISDLFLGMRASARIENDEAYDDLPIFIELKPLMGDDYPAVLRQMKAQQEKAKKEYLSRASWVLLVGEYSGRGASPEDVRKTFAESKIRVVIEQTPMATITSTRTLQLDLL